VNVLPDVARESPAPLNENQTDEASIWLASVQISREIAAGFRESDVLLCDRGVPDILAHHQDVEEGRRGGRVAL